MTGTETGNIKEGLRTCAEFPGERREIVRLPGNDFSLGTLHLPLADAAPRRFLLLLPGWTGPRSGPSDLLVRLAAHLAAGGAAAMKRTAAAAGKTSNLEGLEDSHTTEGPGGADGAGGAGGIVVLRPDFHSRGDSPGDPAHCNLDRMIADAERRLFFLKERFPAAEAFVGGLCSGANTALGLASLRPKEVAGVAALSALPFQQSRDTGYNRRRRLRTLKDYAGKALSPHTWARLWRGEIDLSRVRKNLSAADAEYAAAGDGEAPATPRNLKDSARDIEAMLLDWKGRALFIWGEGDEEAAPAKKHFEELHAAGMAGEARFELVAGAEHNFQRREWREAVAGLLTDFLFRLPTVS